VVHFLSLCFSSNRVVIFFFAFPMGGLFVLGFGFFCLLLNCSVICCKCFVCCFPFRPLSSSLFVAWCFLSFVGLFLLPFLWFCCRNSFLPFRSFFFCSPVFQNSKWVTPSSRTRFFRIVSRHGFFLGIRFFLFPPLPLSSYWFFFLSWRSFVFIVGFFSLGLAFLFLFDPLFFVPPPAPLFPVQQTIELCRTLCFTLLSISSLAPGARVSLSLPLFRGGLPPLSLTLFNAFRYQDRPAFSDLTFSFHCSKERPHGPGVERFLPP